MGDKCSSCEMLRRTLAKERTDHVKAKDRLKSTQEGRREARRQLKELEDIIALVSTMDKNLLRHMQIARERLKRTPDVMKQLAQKREDNRGA